MKSVSQNGILEENEFGEFKARTVRLRFMQQISYGVGAAMVFGLITAVASRLVPDALGWGGAAAGLAPVLATVGLAGIALAGVGLIYLSAKFLSENTLLEQDFQAKKIGIAARGVSPTVEQPLPQRSDPSPLVGVEAAQVDSAKPVPVTQIEGARMLEGRYAAQALQPAASRWQDRVAANDATPAAVRA